MSITLFPFLYAMLFVVAMVSVLTAAVVLFLLKKRGVVVHIIGLYLFYAVDAMIVFQLECSPDFNAWFERGFMYNPSIKTVVFMGCALFWLYVLNDFFGRRLSKIQIASLVLLALFLLIFPLVGVSPTISWLYFTAYQVFTICWSLYGLRLARKMEEGRTKKTVCFLLLASIVLSISIAVEDAVVIFNYDCYSVECVVIHIRNISEDMLRIVYTIVFFGVYLRDICAKGIICEGVSVEEAKWVSDEEPKPEPEAAQQLPSAGEEFKIIKFAQELILTGRELEVFQRMVAGKSNQQISEELCISMGTVKAHVHNIFQKAGVTHRYELMRKFDAYDLE